MIVLEDKQTVILTPPGTSPGLVHQAICQRRKSYWVLGTQSKHCVDEATNRIPYRWESYQIMVVVRNPYTRALALFDHYNEYRKSVTGLEPSRLETFISQLGSHQPYYSETITDWACQHDRATPIRYESLAKDFKKELGIQVKVKLPDYADWREKWYKVGADLMTYFRAYAVNDLFKFGYAEKAISETEAKLKGV